MGIWDDIEEPMTAAESPLSSQGSYYNGEDNATAWINGFINPISVDPYILRVGQMSKSIIFLTVPR
jgi:hypothetical protein